MGDGALGVKGRDRRGADRSIEFGAVPLLDMADVVKHPMHGAVGALVVEPKGATWQTDPGTEAQANVTVPGGTSFRELVAVAHDELGLHSSRFGGGGTLNSGTAVMNLQETDDAEDSGHPGFNYRTEPLWARLGVPPQVWLDAANDAQQADLLSSGAHGDPATPVFTVKARTPVRFRLVQPSGHPRQHTFALHGAEWLRHPWRSGSSSTVQGQKNTSFIRSSQDGITARSAHDFIPQFGGGLGFGTPGDLLYRDQASFRFPEGMWGIVRVTP
jgi:hypothetical protein